MTRIGIWLEWKVHWHRFMLSLIINYNIMEFENYSRKLCILIWLNRCNENQIFPRNSFFSSPDILMFLYWLIHGLQVNRMCITSFWFHPKLVKKTKNIAINYTYGYTVFLSISFMNIFHEFWKLTCELLLR